MTAQQLKDPSSFPLPVSHRSGSLPRHYQRQGGGGGSFQECPSLSWTPHPNATRGRSFLSLGSTAPSQDSLCHGLQPGLSLETWSWISLGRAAQRAPELRHSSQQEEQLGSRAAGGLGPFVAHYRTVQPPHTSAANSLRSLNPSRGGCSRPASRLQCCSSLEPGDKRGMNWPPGRGSAPSALIKVPIKKRNRDKLSELSLPAGRQTGKQDWGSGPQGAGSQLPYLSVRLVPPWALCGSACNTGLGFPREAVGLEIQGCRHSFCGLAWATVWLPVALEQTTPKLLALNNHSFIIS